MSLAVYGAEAGFPPYLLQGTIQIEEELDDPEHFIEEFRAGRLTRS